MNMDTLYAMTTTHIFTKLRVLMAVVVVIITTLFTDCRYSVSADMWSEPVTFYNSYGNSAVFKPDSSETGRVFFCTVGNTSSSGTRYRTIGYKMRVLNQSGNCVQNIYYSLSGGYIKSLKTVKKSNKEYALYSLDLSIIKSRLDRQAANLLETGRCSIVIDACMVVRKNGKNSGSMNDNGPTSGKVYDTYSGIANAAGWTSSALESLHSYFGKSVVGLFHTIKVTGGVGISKTTGGGVYCYGTYVTIRAECKRGYTFKNWNNINDYSANPYTRVVNFSTTFIGYAVPESTSVRFWRNSFVGDTESIVQTYTYNKSNQIFPETGWKTPGYHMLGWSDSKDAANASYKSRYIVSDDWILKNKPSKNIYATWKENSYTIRYDTGEIVHVKYTDTVTLPYEELCIGWKLSESEPESMYKPGDNVPVEQLCRALGIEYTDGAEIPLYALWEHVPTIEANDMFFPVEQALQGRITNELIGSYIYATDLEDGDIKYGDNGVNHLLIKDLDVKKIEKIKDGESISVTIEAKDSYGNIAEKQIKITFAETGVKNSKETFGTIRFISNKYFDNNKAGGLMENSRWIKDPSFNALLRRALAT